MSLAIFDLDNTLIAGDSDHSWGEFLVEKSLVDAKTFKQGNDQFYQDYLDGTLDIIAYQAFALAPLTRLSQEQLRALQAEFMAEKIQNLMLEKAQKLIDSHRSQNHKLLIITATNRFIAAPIAKQLNIENLLATEPEIINKKYTGRITGTPCFQEGKVTRLQSWLNSRELDLTRSYFYSDSHNDLPLLKRVSHPVAVDPDEKLKREADQRGWNIISLR
ncbi:MAG: HAD-IB family hydrolase [Cellvibrionaceae bacterium]|nr:HAD-IB family hydrolase [Cellvibrionaceae bacterium]